MRISALIIRLWGDVAAQPLALFIVALIVMMLAVLAAVGLVVAEHRIERWVRPRLRRCLERRRTVWRFRRGLAFLDSRQLDAWARAERHGEDG